MAIDEATASLLAQMAGQCCKHSALQLKPMQAMTPQEARAFGSMLRALSGSGPELARAYQESLPTPDGSQFEVRVLVPGGDVAALVVYYHGGGWVIGTAEEYDTLGRVLAERLGVAVVLADYRLAPEHRFPVAADDATLALQWADQQMEAIAGRRVPLVVMGDSAGGNLAAVAARRARDAGGPRIDAQVLVYPVTDADLDTACYTDPDNQFVLTRESMTWYWDHYAPDPAQRMHQDAAPLRAADLAGLPPAIVLTAEHDVLRQEGEDYAAALREAGVPVEYRCFAGQIHGFFALLNVLPGSAEAIEYIAGQLARSLA